MGKLLSTFIVGAVVILCPGVAGAQHFEVGGQVASVSGGEFDGSDTGYGGRLSWNPIALIGLEGEVTFYPGDYPDPVAFSAGRTEYFFGVTIGPKIGPVRPFLRARVGGLDLQAAPRPFACLAIYPPQLSCSLAAGETLTAYDIGGGLEVFPSGRLFLRVDVGDRILKYPGPATRPHGGMMTTDGFYGNEFRIAAGAGLRF